MSVDTTDAPMSTEEAKAEIHALIDTMPESAAHEFVGLLMDVEAAARDLGEDFEVQHKETAKETVRATFDAYPSVVADVLAELVLQIMLAELLNEYL